MTGGASDDGYTSQLRSAGTNGQCKDKLLYKWKPRLYNRVGLFLDKKPVLIESVNSKYLYRTAFLNKDLRNCMPRISNSFSQSLCTVICVIKKDDEISPVLESMAS